VIDIRQQFSLLSLNYYTHDCSHLASGRVRREAPTRRAGGEARLFSVRFSNIRERGGKVGNLLLVFHFSIRLLPPELWKCGNLACPWRDFQGAVERGGSLVLAFHAFHSPAISTALFAFVISRHLCRLVFCAAILLASRCGEPSAPADP